MRAKQLLDLSNLEEIPEDDRGRFWEKVNLNGRPNGELGNCWIWVGGYYSNGYGQFWFNRKGIKAVRFSWMLHFGPIPPDMCVCHKCDNKRCVKPTHLFLGTHQDNLLDRDNKGRQAKGELIYTARLNTVQVLEARKLFSAGMGLAEIKKSLAVDITLEGLKDAVLGNTWRHLPGGVKWG